MQSEKIIWLKLRHAACLLFLTLSITGCSYTRDLTVLSRRQAIADLDYLVKNLKAIHPDPFTRISEEQFDTQVQQIKANLGDKTHRKDFSLLIAELLALICDDHTKYEYQLSDLYAYLHSGGKIFPLTFRFNNSQMVVDQWAKNFEPQNLKKEDVMVAINGTPMESLLKRYGKYISAETDLQKNWSLEKWMYYFLWLTEEEQEWFELKLQNSEGGEYIERIPAVKYSIKKNKRDKEKRLFSFSFYMENKVCILKARSFQTLSDYVTGKKKVWQMWVDTLNNLFAEMTEKGTSVLIVDLRGNGGGNGALPAELIKRTAKKPYKEYSKKWRYSKAYQKACLIWGLRQRGIPAWLHLENRLDLRNYMWGPEPSQLQGEYFITQHGITDSTVMYNPWMGNLVILTDHYTSSASVWMAAIIKDNELGVIAGEETGGRASFFGDIAPVCLPYSGLSCQISSSYSERPAGYDDDRGVLPDLPLDVMLEDSILVEKIYNHIKTN